MSSESAEAAAEVEFGRRVGGFALGSNASQLLSEVEAAAPRTALELLFDAARPFVSDLVVSMHQLGVKVSRVSPLNR